MHLSKQIKLTTSLLFLNLLCLTPASIIQKGNDINKKNFQPMAGEINTNTQEYVINKTTGEKRTIYWTKGVDAPKMAADEDLATLEGRYFRKKTFNEVDGKYSLYYYPMENNKSYYDFNKNPQRTNLHPQQVAHHCYLASALNLISWWMKENSSYIDRYVDLISKGYFTQSPDLAPIDNLDMWNRYRVDPTIKYISDRDYYSMDLSDNPLYKEVFKSFQTRDEGYWPDLVWDSFFNGYTPPGKEELYMPKKDGGFFYPLLGNASISKRINMGSYEFFSKTVLENLKAGNAMALSFISVGPAHAITIWGAEVDQNGDLQRIYFTDSDDFDATEKTKEGILKGLYSNEVVKDSKGDARITTREDRTRGSKIDAVFILSLAEDKLEASLNDLIGPIAPKFKNDLPDLGYKNASEEPRSLNVEVIKEDNGILSYQWYVANDLTSPGEKIVGATKASYTPTPLDGKDQYFYCEVTNTRHNQKAVSITNRSRVFIDPNVINALKPNVSYVLNNGSREFKYDQYQQSKPLKINVNKLDDGIITYQWFIRDSLSNSSPINGTLLEGEIYPILYPKTNVSGVAFDYYCEVTNTNPSANGIKKVVVSPPKVLTVITLNAKPLLNAMKPNIVSEPIEEINYDETSSAPLLKVHASTCDDGKLSYQWFSSNDLVSEGEKIVGATQNTYYPPVNISGTKYYYCEVTNTNNLASNLKTSKALSRRSKITVSGAPSLSDNAYLSAINLTNGTLSPSFDKDIYSYTVSLPLDISETTITGISEVNSASISGNKKVTLVNGESELVEIKVTAEDGIHTKTYKVLVERASCIKDVKVKGSYIYNAKEQNVDLDVYNSKDQKLTLNVDYTIVYLSDRINAGVVNFIVKGINNYQGDEKESSFKINKAQNKVELSYVNGEIVATSTYGTIEYKYYLDIEGTKEISKPQNNGRYYVKGYVNESNNYTYAESAIIAFDIKNTFGEIKINGKYIFNGLNQNVDVDVYSDSGDKLVIDVDYKIEYLDENINAGIIRFKVVGINKYLGVSKELTYQIEKATNKVDIKIENGELSASSTYGEVTYKYYLDKEGKKEIEKPEENGTYYAKAIVEESSNYQYAESELIEYIVNIESNNINASLVYGLTFGLALFSAIVVVTTIVLVKKKKHKA